MVGLRRELTKDERRSQASIHAIMESDDRVTFVIKHLDDALAELDKMDLMIGLYKAQLNVRHPLIFLLPLPELTSLSPQLMTDDIAHIEGQNRGLQVQTSNQRMLLSELDNLMVRCSFPPNHLNVGPPRASLRSLQSTFQKRTSLPSRRSRSRTLKASNDLSVPLSVCTRRC
jgi:hypothetical protein